MSASFKWRDKDMLESVGMIFDALADWIWERWTWRKRRKYAAMVRRRLGVE